jgi:O-antigen ligase
LTSAATAPKTITAQQQTVGNNAWLHAIWLVAFLPFLQTLVTWDYDGQMTSGWFALRHFSIPTIFGEVFVIYLALRGGMLPSHVIEKLSKPVKSLLVIWLLFALVSTLINGEQIANSLLTLIRFILHGLFLASLIHLLNHAGSFSICKWLEIITLGVVSYLCILTVFILTIPEPTKFPWVQRLPSATNIRQIADIIAILAIAPIGLILFGSKSRKWFYALTIFAISLFISWSGSRGALFAMVAASIVPLILFRYPQTLRSSFIAISAFLSGSMASLILPLPAGSFGLFRFVDKVQSPGNVTSGRMEMWISTITEIGKNPWIGYGSGNFNVNMREQYGFDFNHPHNFILQFTYDWGIFGASAALLLIATLAFSILKKSASNGLTGFTALSALSTLLIISMVDGTLFHPLPILLTLTMVAPIFRLAQNQEA